MPSIAIGIIIAAAIIIFIAATTYFSKKDPKSSNSYIPSDIHSQEYRTQIYNNTPTQYRQEIQRLYNRLDDVGRIISSTSASLNDQTIQIATEVLNKAYQAEREIEQHWQQSRNDANFYYYIGLHYTSFTLADKLTEELETLREYNRLLTKIIINTQKQIDELAGQINSGNSYNIATLKSQHRSLCQKCKALRETRNICTKQKDLVAERRDRQNVITGKRRDYIGEHCGSKGRQWRAKIMSRHNH